MQGLKISQMGEGCDKLTVSDDNMTGDEANKESERERGTKKKSSGCCEERE